MAYATIAHVNARCPMRTFTGSSNPSIEETLGFLQDSAAVLDGIVAGLGYLTPVPPTATVSLAILKRANAIGAWAEVEQAAPSNKKDQAELAMKQWADAVKLLRELPDAPRNTGESYARGARASAFFTANMAL